MGSIPLQSGALLHSRKPKLVLENAPNPYYHKGNSLISHLLNCVDYHFPIGERFIIRSIQQYQELIENPDDLLKIQVFLSQETQHSCQLLRVNDVLKRYGYPIDLMLERTKLFADFFYKILPRDLCLAITVGAEHVSTGMAKFFLANKLYEGSQPLMGQIHIWHSVEELEHKCVAFDLLNKLHPYNYLLRILGYFLGILGILAMAIPGFFSFFFHDFRTGRLTWRKFRNDFKEFIRDKGWRGVLFALFIKDFFVYLKPWFHPSQIKTDHLLKLYIPEVEKFT